MASALQRAKRGPFSFFWLPAEVRCLIYQQLFDAQEDGAVNVPNLDPFHKIIPIFPYILRTCRTIYTEAVSILYKMNKFRLGIDHEQHFAPLELLFGGIRTSDFLHNVQLVVSDHELLSETSEKTYDTYQLIKELSSSRMPRGSFSIAFQKCWNTGLDGTAIAIDVTNMLVQSIRALSAFEEVVVVGLPFDDHGHPAKMIWSKAFRRELESGLGPNHSLKDTRLEFRPRSKPRNWIRKNIAPLMRLPSSIRSRIMGIVLGPGAFSYPSEPYYSMHQNGHRTDWDMVATIARCNPRRDLKILFTCRKLWEEGWQLILVHRRMIFNFDFGLVDEFTNHESTAQHNAMWLPSTTLRLHNLDDTTDIWGTFNHLESLLRSLSKFPIPPFIERAIPKRGHFILEIGIHQMRWRRYPRDEKMRLTRKEYKMYRNSQHPDIYYSELHGVPYINARNGHDIEIGKYLKRMTEWRRVDIVLLPETLKSHCWRREVTDHLEDTLGPQLSSRRDYLSFRPRYFRNLSELISRKTAYEFMLGRTHFSDDVIDDLHGIWDYDSDYGDNDDYRNPNDESNVDDSNENPGGAYGVQELSAEADVIDAINEYELAEALYLSALEASATGYSLGSEDEQPGTDNEESA
ncbi:hypothetical protein MMC18_003599 [Xylographa bjoerkii]|nr:hypothetical protein [Xylographa bjoerkii]